MPKNLQTTPSSLRKMICLFIIPLISLLSVSSVTGDRIVDTNIGPVQGITIKNGDIDIEAFLGIPYAESPVGRLRFMRPVPKTPWQGVYDASSLPPPCIQNLTILLGKTQMEHFNVVNMDHVTEDCLFLNLWVPYSKSPSEPKAVLVFIYGGAFIIGSSGWPIYNGAKLAEVGDIIVVTLNYRVGVMGYFSAFVDEANGNMGMYDQVLAMKWVKENVKSFGGDPDRIVLSGQSAGSISVSGHLISPMTKNLFKRVIMQSGSAINPFLSNPNSLLFNNSQKISHMVGCSNKSITLLNNPVHVVECMKRLPARTLSNAEALMQTVNPLTFFPRTGDEYISEDYVREVVSGRFQDADMLIGANADEGKFFLISSAPDYFGQYGRNRVKSMRKLLASRIIQTAFKAQRQTFGKEAADFYINSIKNGTSDSYMNAMSHVLGDFIIVCGTLFQADFQSLRNPVYFYMFSRKTSSSLLADWIGATHFEEFPYVFGNPLWGNFTEEELEFSRHLMTRWAAFAKTGNPNIPGTLHWPKFTFGDPEYLVLDVEESVHRGPFENRCEFWRHRFHATIDDKVVAIVTNEIPRKATANRDVVLSSNILLLSISLFCAGLQMLHNKVAI